MGRNHRPPVALRPMSSGTYPCPRCGIVRAARNAAALCRDCAATDPTWGRRETAPIDYDDEPGPWVDEDGRDRTPGRDLDRIGGWL